jgi:hypothetical protein
MCGTVYDRSTQFSLSLKVKRGIFKISRRLRLLETTFFRILFLLLASAVYTQNIHEVVPGSKGNGIILCIVNESKTNSADNIAIVVSNNPKGVEFNYSEVKISILNPGEEREAVFSFESIQLKNYLD